MQVIATISEMRQLVKNFRQKNQSIALVPTMGFLHAGHAALIKNARLNADIVIVSIFVNPLQFNVKSDLDNYPRDLDGDALFCKNLGIDIIFAPNAIEMYPNGKINAMININNLDKNLCGRTRVGHFTGVCSVVSKLFNIITPDVTFFGKKDIQQLRIIETMVDDLNFNVSVVGCETIREDDGLALSSRNTHLSTFERIKSAIVPELLQYILGLIQNGLYEVETLMLKGREFLKESNSSFFGGVEDPNIKLDYLEIVDYQNLQLLEKVEGKFIIATAIFIGNTRLIDNIMYEI